MIGHPNKELFILDNIIVYFIPRRAPTISRRIDSGTKKEKNNLENYLFTLQSRTVRNSLNSYRFSLYIRSMFKITPLRDCNNLYMLVKVRP